MARKYNPLGAATLADDLYTEFTGRVEAVADYANYVQGAVSRAAQHVWGYRNWGFTQGMTTIDTVASTGYSALTGIATLAVPRNGLYDTTTASARCEWVDPLQWPDAIVNAGTDEERPEKFTLGRDTSTLAARLLWSPTPDAVYTFGGIWARFRVPTIYFATIGGTGNNDTTVFSVCPELDDFWVATARKEIAMSAPLREGMAGLRRDILAEYVRAAAEAVQHVEIVTEVQADRAVDIYGMPLVLGSAGDSQWRSDDWKRIFA
jgi:hypothetical protein